MGTEFLNVPLHEYVYHKSDEAESAEEYSYYLYIHPSGQAIIMRIRVFDSDTLYANAGRRDEKWTDRVDGVTYRTFDKLARG